MVEWNASAYDRVADPQTWWGAVVLDRLPLEGDERVLDAGCGTSRMTELLAEARRRLARFGERVECVRLNIVAHRAMNGAKVA